MDIRIVVCGDEQVGKSSLITCLVKQAYVPNIQPLIPPLTLPAVHMATTYIIDTSASLNDRDELRKEVRRANVILLLFADDYTRERISLFWMPFFRSLGVNVPVILCGNKCDLHAASSLTQPAEEEIQPVLLEFKEIELCIRTSAKELIGVNEAFHFCQRAILYPVVPLYDSKEQKLKPAAIDCLRRVFYLLDTHHNDFLSDAEMKAFQV